MNDRDRPKASDGSARRLRLALAALLATLLAAGLALLLYEGGLDELASHLPGDTEAEGGAPPTPVRIVETESGRAETMFTTSGRVRAADDVTLTVEVPGRVAEILIADAARVAAGDTLLRLVDDDQQAARAAARARLDRAEADLARARQLFDEDVAAEARVETALADSRAARAELAAAEAALADLTLRAPFAGRVGFVDASPGAYLEPGEPVARLTAVEDRRIRFSLPQRLAETIGPGATVAVSRDGETCGEAEIVALAPAMSARTRSREVEARAPDGCALRDGGFVAVSVVVAARDHAVFAPQSAIRREGFEAWVYAVAEGEDGPVARRTPVTLGVLSDDRVEIREGLEAGARIVGDGAHRVTDGDRLRPIDEAGE